MSAEITLDPQQQAAVDARHNVVVSAGAGSGKTRVLTERYLDLVRSGVDVASILTLTFTRKAAAEMFRRIHQRLSRAVTDADDAGNDVERALLHRQVERFDEAQISTLDSFCAGILRESATRFGLPPTIQSDDMRLERSSRVSALCLLATHGEHPVLGEFLRHSGVAATLDQLLLPVAMHHLRLSRPIDFSRLAADQEEWLSRHRGEIEGEIDRAVAEIIALDVGGEGPQELKTSLSAAVERRDDPHRYHLLSDILEAFDRRRMPRGDAGAELKERLNVLLEKKSGKRGGLLPRWADIVATAARLPELRSLYELLTPFQDDVLAARRRSGLLSHQEVMELAVRALREDLELRSVYKERFRYIMIDEFQDNNATQRDLLFLLAEDPSHNAVDVPSAEHLQRDKLFFVGDQKQSIYRFRGADVAVFRGLAADVGRSTGDGPATLSLDTNYRSEPHLIRFFNALFPDVFGEAEEPWDAEFQPLAHREASPDAQPAVTLAWVGEPAEDDAGEDEAADLFFSEAGWIAEEIRRLTVVEGRYRPGEIAVLYRTSGNQQKLERMLRRAGVPYRTQAVRSLFTEAPASDLYSLLQLCFFPEDRSALAAYLRSPLVMLSDAAVVAVVTGAAEWALATDTRNVSEPVEEPETFDPQDRRKLDRARELYIAVRSRLDRVSTAEVVRMIWEEGGYRYALLHRSSDHPYLEHLSYLYSLALRYDGRPAVEFVDYLREQMGETEKIDELELPGGDDAVQLMTIHKSKGLEFPVVFVSGMGGGSAARHNVLWEDPELGLTVRLPDPEPGRRSANVFEDHARDVEERQDEAELRRLLYVACTRAEERLYLTASVGRRRTRRPMWDLFAAAIGWDGSGETVAPSVAPFLTVERIPVMTERELREHAVPQTARRTHVDAARLFATADERSFTAPEVETTPSELNARLEAAHDAADPQGPSLPGLEAAVGGEDASTVGTLTHALLERALLVSAPSAKRSARSAETDDDVREEEWLSFPSWAERALTAGQAETVTAEMLDESWTLARRFLDSPFLRSLGSSADDVRYHAELPFLLYEEAGDRFVKGTIDLVVETDDRVWVIDYKTDRRLHPEHYAGQMSVYRRAAREIFDKPVELRLFGLRDGTAYEVPDRYADLVELMRRP